MATKAFCGIGERRATIIYLNVAETYIFKSANTRAPKREKFLSGNHRAVREMKAASGF
jgi:hypothetical protein